MRPQQVALGAVGFSAWQRVNRMPQGDVAIGLAGRITPGASLTWSAQVTYDQLYEPTQEWSASRTTTTGTITRVAHGLSVGDWTQMDAAAPFDSAYSVASVVDADNYTITVANSGATSVAKGASNLWTARVFEHAVLTGQTISLQGSIVAPPTAVRLAVTTWVSGRVTLDIIQAG